MKRLFAFFVIGLSLAAFAQDTPDIILVTNQVTMAVLPQANPQPSPVPVPLQIVTQQVVNVYRKVATQSPTMLILTNTPLIKGVRQWKKQCPFCKNDCVSTNSTSWTVNGQDGEPEARLTTVTFTCTHADCGERFNHTIQLKLPKTAIEEIPPVP